MQKEIEITHKITVDECLIDEILELNNDHNILTLYCCCGHGKEKGAIVVSTEYVKTMLEIGYVIHDEYGFMGHRVVNINDEDFDIGTVISLENKDEFLEEYGKWLPSFRPKSKCKCISKVV